MDKFKTELKIKRSELDNLKNNSDYYNKLHLKLLKGECLSKMRRYGSFGYSNKYLKSKYGIVSSHLMSYYYLKDMNKYIDDAIHSTLSEIEILEMLIN